MIDIKEFQGEYRWLSNFYPCMVEYDGNIFPSVEHAYQATKALYQEDFLRIKSARTAGEAKRIGRSISTVNNWDEIKDQIMYELLVAKFSIIELREKLIKTGEGLIQEGNRWRDEYWGINLETGKGQNILGKLLMKVRGEIKA